MSGKITPHLKQFKYLKCVQMCFSPVYLLFLSVDSRGLLCKYNKSEVNGLAPFPSVFLHKFCSTPQGAMKYHLSPVFPLSLLLLSSLHLHLMHMFLFHHTTSAPHESPPLSVPKSGLRMCCGWTVPCLVTQCVCV